MIKDHWKEVRENRVSQRKQASPANKRSKQLNNSNKSNNPPSFLALAQTQTLLRVQQVLVKPGESCQQAGAHAVQGEDVGVKCAWEEERERENRSIHPRAA